MKQPSIRKLKESSRQAAEDRGHHMGHFAKRKHSFVTNYIALCHNCHRIALVCSEGYCGDATRTDCPQQAQEVLR